jgi:hypothetical protein
MGMAAYYHVPPWEIEQGLTLEWLWRWRAWNEEQPAPKQANKK